MNGDPATQTDTDTPPPELAAIERAFAAGDYAFVRDAAAKLEAGADSTLAKTARALVAKTTPDPLARGVFLVTFALLVTIAWYWLSHGAVQTPPS